MYVAFPHADYYAQSDCPQGFGRFGAGLPCKPCHNLLYISGDFRRLYPVGPSAGLLWWQKS